MQLEKAINIYLKSRSSRLAANTIRIYQRNLTAFNKWVGGIELAQIEDNHVDDFLYQLKDSHREVTRSNYANALRAFFKHWFAKRESNVAWELISGPRVPERFPDFISKEQFDLIDDCFDEDEYYQLTKKVIFHLLWNTGMRLSELLSLNIHDIHLQKKYVYITTAKSKKLRMVMWNDYCHRLLIKYLGTRISLNKAPELFQTPPNPRYRSKRTRLSGRSVQRWCRELEELLGFRVHPHAFRHGKCHQIINSGGNRHHVQTIAGHSSITASEIYTRLNLKEQSRILEQFLPEASPERTEKGQPFKLSPYYFNK